jgi:hypothetical protein
MRKQRLAAPRGAPDGPKTIRQNDGIASKKTSATKAQNQPIFAVRPL